MGGAVSSGESNDELIDNLLESDCIKTIKIERIFRAVDRGIYYTDAHKSDAYKDLAWKDGNLHLSAPCIYSEVMENIKLGPGMSFLNMGSGTGYLSTMCGLIIGKNGINHGIELHQEVAEYAREKLEEFLHTSAAIDGFDFCIPQFVVGNCLHPISSRIRYDRIYCGAACPEEFIRHVTDLLKVDGICIMPINDSLVQITRTADGDTRKGLLPVSFATLIEPVSSSGPGGLIDKNKKLVEVVLPALVPLSLKEMCRVEIRSLIRSGFLPPGEPSGTFGIDEGRQKRKRRQARQDRRRASRLLVVQRRRAGGDDADTGFMAVAYSLGNGDQDSDDSSADEREMELCAMDRQDIEMHSQDSSEHHDSDSETEGIAHLFDDGVIVLPETPRVEESPSAPMEQEPAPAPTSRNNGQPSSSNNGQQSIANNGQSSSSNNGQQSIANNGQSSFSNNGQQSIANNDQSSFSNNGRTSSERDYDGRLHGAELLRYLEAAAVRREERQRNDRPPNNGASSTSTASPSWARRLSDAYDQRRAERERFSQLRRGIINAVSSATRSVLGRSPRNGSSPPTTPNPVAASTSTSTSGSNNAPPSGESGVPPPRSKRTFSNSDSYLWSSDSSMNDSDSDSTPMSSDSSSSETSSDEEVPQLKTATGQETGDVPAEPEATSTSKINGNKEPKGNSHKKKGNKKLKKSKPKSGRKSRPPPPEDLEELEDELEQELEVEDNSPAAKLKRNPISVQMRNRIKLLPLPPPVQSYLNFNRAFDLD